MRNRSIAAVVFAGYVGTIWLANALLAWLGVVFIAGVGVPAGVFAVGLAFWLRDELQEQTGPWLVVVAIVLGAATSYLIAPVFAVASGVTFLASELADFVVYTPLRRRNEYAAISASNTVGAFVDSWLFLTLSGLGLAFMPGQVIGKLVMILPVFAIKARSAFLARDA